MASKAQQQPLLRTIRLNDDRIAAILDALESVASAPSHRRVEPRYRYRVPALVVSMERPGLGGPVAYLVVGRNLSTQGLAFLHGGFLHPQTRCTTQLLARDGTLHDVTGRVVRCRYVEGNVHEIAVRFDAPIRPVRFCADAAEGRVLLLDHDPSVARVTVWYLRQRDAHVDYVTTAQEAIQRVAAEPFDAVLSDLELPGAGGLAVAAIFALEDTRG